MNVPKAPKDSPRSTASDDRWKELTQQANAAYANQEDATADDLYQSALEEADRLLRGAEKGIGPAQAPAILVISHHNLAELALKRGQAERAAAHYQGAFDRLLRLAGNTSAPLELREACVPHLKIALIALVGHLRTCGAPSIKLAGEIERARHVMHAARSPLIPKPPTARLRPAIHASVPTSSTTEIRSRNMSKHRLKGLPTDSWRPTGWKR